MQQVPADTLLFGSLSRQSRSRSELLLRSQQRLPPAHAQFSAASPQASARPCEPGPVHCHPSGEGSPAATAAATATASSRAAPGHTSGPANRPGSPIGWRPECSPGLGPHQPPCPWARRLMAAGVPRPGPYKSFAPRQLRPPNHPAAAGAQRHQNDHDLPADGSKRDLEGGQKPAGLPVRKSKVQSLKSKVRA
jgi:hypothetical protein